jgi:uncharacterized protein (DUF433 family)
MWEVRAAMPQMVAFELADDQAERLERLSRRLGKTPGETTAVLVEERLRESEFPGLEYRDSAAGRQPYVRGTRLPVWQLVRLVEAYNGDAAAAASHLRCSVQAVQDAVRYAEAHSGEVAAATAEGSPDYEELKRLLPDLHLTELPS